MSVPKLLTGVNVKSVQDHYSPLFCHCYGCGPANVKGHRLKSFIQDGQAVARFTLAIEYTGGFPDKVYGGMLASLLDCHGAATAAGLACIEECGELREGLNGIRFVTASLKVDFKLPTPIGEELILTGELASLNGRKADVYLTLSVNEQVCVTGSMLAIALPRI